jgi:hypothetical protein
VASGELWTRLAGRSIWNRTGKTVQDRTYWTGHLGLNNWDSTVKTGRIGQVSLLGNLNRTERTGQPAHDKVVKMYIFQKC